MNARSRWSELLPMVAAALLCGGPVIATESPDSLEPPLLVLLTDTGEIRGDLPVLEPKSDSEETHRALSRGLPRTILRVYRWVQIYRDAREGVGVEPAYVLLSDRQGGFARRGFMLGDIEKPEAAYIDVHQDWPATGEFGALDQIVPHEMAHAIRRHLVGPLADGGANQVHSLALKTDPVTAFNEGFAEHLQPMAIEHPDADPGTSALATHFAAYQAARRRLRQYSGEVSARFAAAPRLRMGFLAWYSNDEDVLRHFAVKENAFAREPDLPERLLERGDLYSAYLLDNILPGQPDAPAKSAARMLSSEGVVSSLFYRWANHQGIRNTDREPLFYEAFGAAPEDVSPLENVYLKLFEVFYLSKPQSTLDVVEGYRSRFPDEARFVDELIAEVFLGQPVVPAVEIWLANTALETGTTLFDQYRGLPRVHTFDLNSASLVDLASVPGVGPPLARRIREAGPLLSLDELRNIEGVDARILEAFHQMEVEMARLLAEAEDESVEDVISIRGILMPYVWRAVVVLLVATVLGAALFSRIRRADGGSTPGRARSTGAGFGASLVALVAGWSLGSWFGALVAVALLFGIPAGLWQLWRTRQGSTALNSLLAWEGAALPGIALITPWL